MKSKQFYLIPRLSRTGAGYTKANKGLMIIWLGRCWQVKKPINERNDRPTFSNGDPRSLHQDARTMRTPRTNPKNRTR